MVGSGLVAACVVGFLMCWYASALHAGLLPQSGWLRPPATWLAPDPHFAASPKSRASMDGADSLCAMTHMWPQYIPVSIPADSLPSAGIREKVAAGHYSLVRYVDANAAGARVRAAGDYGFGPVFALFVPGNAGSGKQVRSLATESMRAWAGSNSSQKKGGADGFLLDFYAVDFDEELSAFHGGYLVDQASYVAAALAHLLRQYPADTPFIIVGHSMGGVVARLAVAQDDPCLALVTLAAPHAEAPAHVHPSLEAAYARLAVTPLPHGAAVVSLSGGPQDFQVHPWLTRISRGGLPLAANEQLVVEEDAPAIPGAWIPATHQGILWCNQVVKGLARGLNDAVEERQGGAERVASALRHHLSSTLPQSLALEPWSTMPWTWVQDDGNMEDAPRRCDARSPARRIEVLGVSGDGVGNTTLSDNAWQSWGWNAGSKAERLSVLGITVVTNLDPGAALILTACTSEGKAVDVTGVLSPLPAPEPRPGEGGVAGDVPRGAAGFRVWAREHWGLDRGRRDTPPLYVGVVDLRAVGAAVGEPVASVEVAARRAPESSSSRKDLLWVQPSHARVPDPDFPEWESPANLFFAKLVGQYHFKQAPGHASVARFPVHSFVYEGPWRGWSFAVRVVLMTEKPAPPADCFAPLLHAMDRVGGEELVFPDVGGGRHARHRGGWTTVSFHAPFDSLRTAPFLTLISDPRCAYDVTLDWTRESYLEALATFWLAHRIGPKSMSAGFAWLAMALATSVKEGCNGEAWGAVGALASAASQPLGVWVPLTASAVLAHDYVGGALCAVALGLGFAGTFALIVDTFTIAVRFVLASRRRHPAAARRGQVLLTALGVLGAGFMSAGVFGPTLAEAIGVFLALFIQIAAIARRVPAPQQATASALVLLAIWPALLPSVAVVRSRPTVDANSVLASGGHALVLRLWSPAAPWVIAAAHLARPSEQVRTQNEGRDGLPFSLPVRALLLVLACMAIHTLDHAYRLVPAAALASALCLVGSYTSAAKPKEKTK